MCHFLSFMLGWQKHTVHYCVFPSVQRGPGKHLVSARLEGCVQVQSVKPIFRLRAVTWFALHMQVRQTYLSRSLSPSPLWHHGPFVYLLDLFHIFVAKFLFEMIPVCYWWWHMALSGGNNVHHSPWSVTIICRKSSQYSDCHVLYCCLLDSLTELFNMLL